MTKTLLKIGSYYKILDRKYDWYNDVGVYIGKTDEVYLFRTPDMDTKEVKIEQVEQHEGQDRVYIERTDKQEYIDALGKVIDEAEKSVEETMKKLERFEMYRKELRMPDFISNLINHLS